MSSFSISSVSDFFSRLSRSFLQFGQFLDRPFDLFRPLVERGKSIFFLAYASMLSWASVVWPLKEVFTSICSGYRPAIFQLLLCVEPAV